MREIFKKDKELVDFVIRQLGRQVGHDDTILGLCEMSSMSWLEAEAFVREVEFEYRHTIAKRQNIFYLFICVATFIAGIGLILGLRLSTLLIGLGMVVGGAVGVCMAVKSLMKTLGKK